MFALISYIFKIIISLGAGYVIGYNSDKESTSSLQFYTSVNSLLMTSVIAIFSYEANNIVPAIIFLSINHALLANFFNDDVLDKFKLIFSSICGLLVGLGFIFHAILITLLFSYIVNNYDIITDLISSKNSKNEAEYKNELDLNDEEM